MPKAVAYKYVKNTEIILPDRHYSSKMALSIIFKGTIIKKPQ